MMEFQEAKEYLMYKIGDSSGEVIGLADEQYLQVKNGYGDYRFKPLFEVEVDS